MHAPVHAPVHAPGHNQQQESRPLPNLTVYPLTNYTFGSKERKEEKHPDAESKLARMRDQFRQHSTRYTVDAILVVHDHKHPHVLMLQLSQSFYRLPGGKRHAGQDDAAALQVKLDRLLSPTHNPNLKIKWDVGECVGTFYRPNFDTFFYPYLPAHCAKAKELKRLYVVHLPDKAMFAVPKNMRLVAVSFYELYDNMGRYGAVLSAVPNLMSRYLFTMIGPPAPPPALPPPQQQQQQPQQMEQ